MDRSVERQINEICEWLSYLVQHEEAAGAVLEVDGGLPCAVTAALAQKALGDTALGVVMPCQSQPQATRDAMLLVKHVGLRHEQIDLSPVHDILLHVLPGATQEANAAIKPRLRMIALHHYAASHNYLVLGSGDRSDWEIGRFTKHGDDSADVFPIIHLLKNDVQKIARHFGIPDHIIRKSHCSGLWMEHKKGPEPGFTFEELDAYLSGDFVQVPSETQRRIRLVQQAAARKRRPALRFSPPEREASLNYDHEAYDKSIEALALISKAITSDQYLEDILRLIVMVTAEVMNSSVCSLWLLDEKEGVLRLRATQSIDKEYLKDRVLRVGEGVVGKVVEEDRPRVVSNVLLDPLFKEKELARRMGLVSMLSMPMRVKDRVIGVVNCYTSHPHVFSDLQMNVLTAVANQAAVAIENTELLVQTRVIQEELERRKIIERAKDLLMKRFELSGEEAYRWLQKRSMNTRKSMREVSEAVLLTMEG